MPEKPEHAALLRTAIELARLGARTVRPFLGRVRATRKNDNSPVTEADHAGQAAILAELSHRHPDHAVLTEETIARPDAHAPIAGAPCCWIIDPIDGTRNFARGVKMYAVCVAALQDGRPVAAAIHDAASECVWSAALGEGAFRDEIPLRMDDPSVGADTTIAVSSFRRRAIPPAVRAWMDQYLFRNLGAVALHLAWVAGGLLDAAYSLECKPWDIAAGSLLIEEAGGVVTDPAGVPIWPLDVSRYAGQDLPILAGTPAMHARLLGSLRS